MKRRLRLFVLLLVLAAAGVAFERWRRIGKLGDWVPVRRGDLVFEVDVTGTLKAVRTEQLGPPIVPGMWDFKISMIAPEGIRVRKGQPVVAFDGSELEQRLREKEAEAEEAEKEIEKKRADLALQSEKERVALAEAEARLRKAELKVEVPAELASRHERRTAELDLELARLEVTSTGERNRQAARAARAELAALESKRRRAAERVAEIRRMLEDLTVKAPVDGLLVHVTNWRNEKKKVGDSSWPGDKIAEIPDLAEMMGTGEVDEVDSGKVAVGQKVRFRLDAHGDREITGRISSLANTVSRQSRQNPLKILQVEIRLDRTDPEIMRPGMRFRGKLETGRAPGLLLAPLAAVRATSDGAAVLRRTLLGWKSVPVQLGRRGGTDIEVVGRLEPGDRLLVERRNEPDSPPGGRP
jgi:multidrug efflux pump subunit AcrA (membrane-fusion protein)